MRIVIQRCTEASVSIGGVVKGAIGPGMMILLGIEDADMQVALVNDGPVTIIIDSTNP